MEKLHASESFKKFLQGADSIIASFLNQYFAHGYHGDLINGSKINYLHYRTDGTISYLPAGKQVVYNAEGEWSREGRQNGKPGRVIRKCFTDEALKNFTDTDVDNFMRQYVSFFSGDYTFSVVRGEEISATYSSGRLANGGGSLNNSCMNGEIEEFFDIYAKSELVSMLTLRNKDQLLCGRALIWEARTATEGHPFKFMDRVYVSHDHLDQMFFDYAKEQGWYRKAKQSHETKTYFMSPAGVAEWHRLEIELDTDHNHYPYIDTFTFGNDGILFNDEDRFHEFSYTDTDGHRQDPDGNDIEGDDDDDDSWEFDVINQCSVNREQAVEIDAGLDRYRGWTHEDETVTIDGDTYYKLDTAHIVMDYYGAYVKKSDAHYSHEENEYIHEDDCVWSALQKDYLLTQNASETENGWISDRFVVLHSDGKHYHEDHLPENEENEENNGDEAEADNLDGGSGDVEIHETLSIYGQVAYPEH